MAELKFQARQQYGSGGSYEEQTEYKIEVVMRLADNKFEVTGTKREWVSGGAEGTEEPYKASGTFAITETKEDCVELLLTNTEEEGAGYYTLSDEKGSKLTIKSDGTLHGGWVDTHYPILHPKWGKPDGLACGEEGASFVKTILAAQA
eukprot:TRINITY_DN928_c0_g1_i1.p1 TRINITY_DN928_c0_g1~~TRINITY_DN928_c0_g1_i1.p1  ORF type:complete len:168 (-),score=25.34 TRINITY_DN928_c0_g1_i1:277-720(-)